MASGWKGMAAAFFEMTLRKIATRGIICDCGRASRYGGCILVRRHIASLCGAASRRVRERAQCFEGERAENESIAFLRGCAQALGRIARVSSIAQVFAFAARLGELTFRLDRAGVARPPSYP